MFAFMVDNNTNNPELNENELNWSAGSTDNQTQSAQSQNNKGSINNQGDKPQIEQNQKPIKSKGNKNVTVIVLGVAIILIAVGLAYFFLIKNNNTTVFTTTIISNGTNSSSSVVTTVISQQSGTTINSCTAITSPGIYSFEGNITTTKQSGDCIEILSSNVRINGNNYHLRGNGPYVNVPPYTYGIFISKVANVTISNLNVSRFSYSIYLNNTSASTINGVKISNSTLSDLVLSDAFNNNIENNIIYGSQSRSGGINVQNGGNNNFISTTFINNAYYGLSLNSSGNSFKQDIFIENPTDMICASNANLRNSNNFFSSSCQTNDYCNFAQCTNNLIYDIENINLGKNINSCGSISSFGTYNLSSNLNLEDYVNASFVSYPCININSPNVRLNCNGKTISNADYGILISNKYNTTLNDCNFENDTYGVFVNDSINTYLNNLNAKNGRVGIYIQNSTAGALSNSTEMNNNIGVYENSTTGFEFKNNTILNNVYGIYFDNGQSNVFNLLKTEGNSGADLYCPANSYNNSNIGSASNISCGTTDCQWLSSQCSTLLPPPLAQIPVFKCGTISISGSYELYDNVTSQNTCFTIAAPNIIFDCNGKQIIGNNQGYGIIDNGKYNVSMKSCNIQNYKYGIYADNANEINTQNTSITGVYYGATYSNISYGSIGNTKVISFVDSGINVSDGSRLNVNGDTADQGLYGSSGFVFNKINESIISKNTGLHNPDYGLTFINSTNNLVNNNTALNNGIFDYYCAGNSAGFYSNKIGIDNGISKSGCSWIVAINPSSNLECLSFASPGIITFESDMVYSYGNTCYTISDKNSTNSDGSVIDCNGHTIYSTSGGTFANVNASDITIKNCYLDNFNTAIISNGKGLSIYNTTITNSKIGILTTNATYPHTVNVEITNTTKSIGIENSSK